MDLKEESVLRVYAAGEVERGPAVNFMGRVALTRDNLRQIDPRVLFEEEKRPGFTRELTSVVFHHDFFGGEFTDYAIDTNEDFLRALDKHDEITLENKATFYDKVTLYTLLRYKSPQHFMKTFNPDQMGEMLDAFQQLLDQAKSPWF